MAKQSPKQTVKKTNTKVKVDFEPNKMALAVAAVAVVSLVLIVMMIYM
jgi:hypothetical protein